VKDQYVGDYNDFVKYALLRAILAHELPLLACWMLTPDDRSTEGGKLAYLEKRESFRHLDPEAFDVMAQLVAAGSRSIAEVEASELLTGAAYFSQRLDDHSSSRSSFFRELWRRPPSVTFFDPDNGFEVPSKPPGLRDSCKYIYWSEVEETFRLGHSVIVFQHFAREDRTTHLRRLLDQLGEATGADVFALRSTNVAFLCAPQLVHERRLWNATRDLTERWGPRLALVRAPASSSVAREMLFDALAFAVDAHGRVEHTRKGTRFPYMIHPIRVAWILERHSYDDELVAAGLLHDTLEDTDVTREQIAERFGDRVADLVEAVSEADRAAEWSTRKGATIAKVSDVDANVLPLLAADKLDNVRSIRDTLAERGEDETWRLFRKGRAEQAWYYRSLADAFLARDPTNTLFQTLETEVEAVFPSRSGPTGRSSRQDPRRTNAEPQR
jgi:hypothetical protein